MSNFVRKTPNGGVVTRIIDNKTQNRLKEAMGEGYIEAADVKGRDESTNIGNVRSFAEHATHGKSNLIKSILDDGAVVNVDPRASGIKYNKRVAGEGSRILSIDSSTDKLGHLNSKFTAVVNCPVRPGDIIANDVLNGGQLMVDIGSTVENLGNGTYRTTLGLTKDTDLSAYEDKSEWLNRPFVVTNNFRTEHDTHATSPYSNHMNGGKTLEMLFKTSDKQLVDVTYSDDAGVRMLAGGGRYMDDESYTDHVRSMEDKHAVVMNYDQKGLDALLKNKKPLPKSVYRISGIHYALFKKALELQTNAMWTQQGVDVAGSQFERIYAAPGLWHQARTEALNYGYNDDLSFMNSLRKTSNYIFKGVPVEERLLEIRGGIKVQEKLKKVYKDFFLESNLAVIDQDMLPQRMLEGKNNMNLTYNPIGIIGALLPGIGKVRFIHEPAMDVESKNPSFNSSGNLSRLSGSMLITDARKLRDRVSYIDKMGMGDKLYSKKDYKGSNIIMLKDKGIPMFAFGYEKGRSVYGGEGSSKRHEHSNYVSVNRVSAKFVDTDAVIFIQDYSK